jgi:hypothetical protein
MDEARRRTVFRGRQARASIRAVGAVFAVVAVLGASPAHADLCVGGARDGAVCDESLDCPGICDGGATPGLACTTDPDCASVCIGGAADGQPGCVDDADCGGVCSGGPLAGQACGSPADCGGFCFVSGQPCGPGVACPPSDVCRPAWGCTFGICEPGACTDAGLCVASLPVLSTGSRLAVMASLLAAAAVALVATRRPRSGASGG